MSYLLLLNMSLSPLSRSLSWLNTAAVTALRSLLDPGPYTPAAVPRPGGGYIFISIYIYTYVSTRICMQLVIVPKAAAMAACWCCAWLCWRLESWWW